MRLRTYAVLFVSFAAPTWLASYVAWGPFLIFGSALGLVVLLGVAWVLALPAADGGPPPLAFVLQIWAVLLGLLTVAAVAYLFAPVPVSATSLRGSVECATGSAGPAGDCVHRAGRHWHCDVADGQGSGFATYEVEVDGTCWRARRSSPDSYTETSMPASARGCARLRDWISPID